MQEVGASGLSASVFRVLTYEVKGLKGCKGFNGIKGF